MISLPCYQRTRNNPLEDDDDDVEMSINPAHDDDDDDMGGGENSQDDLHENRVIIKAEDHSTVWSTLSAPYSAFAESSSCRNPLALSWHEYNHQEEENEEEDDDDNDYDHTKSSNQEDDLLSPRDVHHYLEKKEITVMAPPSHIKPSWVNRHHPRRASPPNDDDARQEEEEEDARGPERENPLYDDGRPVEGVDVPCSYVINRDGSKTRRQPPYSSASNSSKSTVSSRSGTSSSDSGYGYYEAEDMEIPDELPSLLCFFKSSRRLAHEDKEEEEEDDAQSAGTSRTPLASMMYEALANLQCRRMEEERMAQREVEQLKIVGQPYPRQYSQRQQQQMPPQVSKRDASPSFKPSQRISPRHRPSGNPSPSHGFVDVSLTDDDDETQGDDDLEYQRHHHHHEDSDTERALRSFKEQQRTPALIVMGIVGVVILLGLVAGLTGLVIAYHKARQSNDPTPAPRTPSPGMSVYNFTGPDLTPAPSGPHMSTASPALNSTQSVDTSPPSCFVTQEELEAAVDAYLSDDAALQAPVAAKYGATMGTWCVGSITNMSSLFSSARNPQAATFNADLSGWDTSRVQDMTNLFQGAACFNQSLSSWNVSSVTRMRGLFQNATSFDQDLSSWPTGSVQDMGLIFAQARSFQGRGLAVWDVSQVRFMSGALSGAASFRADISSWNVAHVRTFSDLFQGAVSFNRDLSGWQMIHARTTEGMFQGASSFRQNLCAWGTLIPSNAVTANMFEGTACPHQRDPQLNNNPAGPFCMRC